MPEFATWNARCVVALVCVASFWMISHSLDMSVTMEVRSGIEAASKENRFAEQQATTTPKSAIGFLIIGAAGIACWTTAPRPARRWNYALLFLCAAYVAFCMASFLWSIDQSQTMRKSAILLLTLVGSFGVAAKFELEDLIWIMILALGGLVVVGLGAEIAYGTFRPWRGDYRFSGTVHPNDQGVQCALLCLAGGLAQWKRRNHPWLRVGMMSLGLAGLWFTQSRTTLGALVAAAAVAATLRARGMKRWLVVTGCIVAACVGGVLYNFVTVSTLDETATVAAMGRKDDLNTLTGRLPLWDELAHEAMRRPLLGHGFGAFWNSKNIFKYSDMFAWHIPHAHNSYLDFILATGFVGLALYLMWAICSAAVAAVQYERSARAGRLFAACFIVFSLVHGAAESKFPGGGISSFLLWIALSMVIAAPRAPVVVPQSLPARRRAPFRVATAARAPVPRVIPPRGAPNWTP